MINDVQAHEAVLSITINQQQGEMVVPFDSAEGDLKAFATEAVRTGGVPGIDADPNAAFHDFVVDRFPARDGKPNRLSLRPKVPFGA